MRKGLIAVGVIMFMAGLAPSLWAGSIINKSNLSADYIRTLNRNAATDMADAAAYNPAGTAMMKDGLYLKADAIYFWKDYSNQLPSTPASVNVGTLDSEEPTLIPGLFAVYKHDRWSTFFAVTIPAGGGKVNYNDGDARTVLLASPSDPRLPGFLGIPGLGTYLGGAAGNATNIKQWIKADSYYVGYSLGAAYKLFDSLSIGGGVRYVDAYQKFKGQAQGTTPPANTIDVKIERTDEAFNYFLGLDWAPVKDLNIGLTYMSNTPLNFKADTRDTSPGQIVSKGVGWVDGTHEREDLPGYIAVGVSYFVIPDTLRIEPNFTYYLEKQAKLENPRFDGAGNSYEYGLAVEYIFNPQWKLSAGYLHSEIKGMESENLLPEAPELDANTLGLGVVWSPIERLSLTLGGVRAWYESEKTGATSSRAPADTEYDKDVWGLSFGIQYRFLD